jgi:hypothetical protein
MLHFVNAVAADIEQEFPNVAINTLAYQYTRKPPEYVKPRYNVIVQLCSIECSFSTPLSEERNRAFRDDIEGWSKICKRLYIWDYTTNFRHYIMPHPNLRVLAPNIKFFTAQGVKGIIEQGDHNSNGGEMAELRAWVLAKLLWDPSLDGQVLIDEFIDGYYGPAAEPIRAYIKLIHDAVEDSNCYLSIKSPLNAPFLSLKVLSQAEVLFEKAEQAAKADSDVLNRVQVARMPLRYVWAMRWYEFKRDADSLGISWPGPADYEQNVRDFMMVARKNHVKKLAERLDIDYFEKFTIGLGRHEAPPPPGCEKLDSSQYIDFQDSSFRFWNYGTSVNLVSDPEASDGVAARMPGNHSGWAVQQSLELLSGFKNEPMRFQCYAVIKCELGGKEGRAFSLGIYDAESRKAFCKLPFKTKDVPGEGYHVYEMGSYVLNPHMYIWVAPPNNPNVTKAVWVDRFFLVRTLPPGPTKAEQ